VKAIDRPTYSICSSDPADVLMNGIFEVLDSYERLEIALKLKRGRMQKAKSGGYSGGGVPYGYVALRGSKGILLEPKEAEAVRRVFELKRMCPWSTLQEIAETLNEEGYHGKNGGVFNLMLAKRIIEKKDFYRGIYKYGGIEAYGKHPAII
jgi:DNA invertase Pin-like site-specific DNA recombinase